MRATMLPQKVVVIRKQHECDPHSACLLGKVPKNLIAVSSLIHSFNYSHMEYHVRSEKPKSRNSATKPVEGRNVPNISGNQS